MLVYPTDYDLVQDDPSEFNICLGVIIASCTACIAPMSSSRLAQCRLSIMASFYWHRLGRDGLSFAIVLAHVGFPGGKRRSFRLRDGCVSLRHVSIYRMSGRAVIGQYSDWKPTWHSPE